MKKQKTWFIATLAACVLLLAACAIFVYAADPCFYYRAPNETGDVFFDQRSQNAGMAKNLPSDTVLMGTSMTANYRTADAAELWGGSAVKLCYPDGYFSEFDTAMDSVFLNSEPARVIFGLDINILLRSEDERTSVMPEYLYDGDPLNDVEYLLNKDSIGYGFYALRARASGETQPVSEAFTWDSTVWWSRETALAGYPRPEKSGTPEPDDYFLADCEANLAVIESWLAEHPNTEFIFFVPPYSILYWDRCDRLGATGATFAALEYALPRLMAHENVSVCFFPDALEIITDLDNYGDHIHHSGAVSKKLLGRMYAGEGLLTPENCAERLAALEIFVTGYNYEALFD